MRLKNPWIHIFEILEVLGTTFKEFNFILVHPSKLDEAKKLAMKKKTKTITFIDENTSQLKKEFFRILPKLIELIKVKGVNINFILIDTTTKLNLSLKEKTISKELNILEDMWRKSL